VDRKKTSGREGGGWESKAEVFSLAQSAGGSGDRTVGAEKLARKEKGRKDSTNDEGTLRAEGKQRNRRKGKTENWAMAGVFLSPSHTLPA